MRYILLLVGCLGLLENFSYGANEEINWDKIDPFQRSVNPIFQEVWSYPIHAAAQQGSIKGIQSLLERGAAINEKDALARLPYVMRFGRERHQQSNIYYKGALLYSMN